MNRFITAVIAALLAVIWLPIGAEAAENGIVEIPVSVLAEGSEPDWNAVYTVELIPQNGDCPMPAGSKDGIYRIAVKGGSTGTVRMICEETGIYDYCLRQIPGKNADCTYDEQMFHLRITVSEGSVSTAVADKNGETVPDIFFRNRWAEPAWVTFSAWVTLDSVPPEDADFRCLLLSADGRMVSEVGNQGKNAVFPALRFAEEGTFRFEMKEVAEPGTGIVYDRAVYTLMVTVRRDGDYRAEISCSRNGEVYTGTPCFSNFTEGSIPKTGDTIGLWMTLMLLSGTALAGMCISKRKPSDG